MSKRRRTLALAALVLAAWTARPGLVGSRPWPTPVLDAQSPALSIVGQLGGPIQAAAVDGHRMLVGVGPRLLVFDGCAPERPIPLGRTEILPGIVQDIQVRDGLAYVAAGVGGLIVVDIRDPAAPRPAGRAPLPGVAARVVLQGRYAYVASGARGMRIVDVADPAAPREVGFYQAIVTDLAVREDYAYVVARNLMQVNIADPSAPRLERKIEDWADAVDMVGPLLYVATSEAGDRGQRIGSIRVWDVAVTRDPARFVGAITVGDPARELIIDAGRAYYQGLTRLTVVDAGDPRAMRILGAAATPETVRSLAAMGAHLLLSAGVEGLFSARVADPSRIQVAEALDTLGAAESVAVAEGHAYVEDEASGNRILIVDLGDPALPRVVGAIPLGVDHGAITASADRLYVGAPDKQLHIFDLAQPAQPRKTAVIPMTRDPLTGREQAIWQIAIEDGRYAYVANDEWLRVYDVADPAAPREVSRRRSSGGATDLAVHDRRAYLLGPATGTQQNAPSLQIIDVFDFDAPLEFSVSNALGSQGGIAYRDGHVFIDAIQIVDVSDPEHPLQRGVFQQPGRNRDSALAGERLYLAASLAELGGTLRVWDLRAAAAPQEAGVLELIEAARGVDAAGGHAFVAATGLGLLSVRDAAQPLPPTPTAAPRPPGLDFQAYLPLTGRGPIAERCE